MEGRPFVKVRNWVISQVNPKSFDVSKLIFILQGNVMSSTVGEVCGYSLLVQDIRGGELPSFLSDTLIISMSLLEAILAPFVSWSGFRRRRFVLVTSTLVALLSTTLLFSLPSANIRSESEFCDAANTNNDISYQGITYRSAIRLAIIITVLLAFQLSRIVSWSHGLAYCDEFAPEKTSSHYGGILLVRVVILMIGMRLVGGLVENLLPVQITILLCSYIYNLVKLLCVVPKHVPEVEGVQKTALPLNGRGFLISMSRVASNSLVLAIGLGASLLSSALWAFGYNREDIIKVNFLMPAETSLSLDLILRHIYIVMPIAMAGYKFSVPILLEYCKKKALKQTVIMTTFALIFFVLLTVLPKCDQGSVAGLQGFYYRNPECSLSCGCKPKWMEFNPVCVTDNMTTFLSPCHAGCTGTEDINGIQVYTHCSCAGTARALPGACATDCWNQYILHDMLFIVATTFTILALQAQGVLILKAVDPRDRSIAIGLMLAMVALLTFACGHAIFLAIRFTTCRWNEGDVCHLQNSLFPYVVGFSSSLMVLLSALISMACFIFMRVHDKRRQQFINTRIGSPY